MKQNTNAEKQSRYRKKEQLKRRANDIWISWQMNDSQYHLKGPQEIRHLVEEAIKLPSRWTEEDYLIAERKLELVYMQTIWPADQLRVDFRDSRKDAITDPAHFRKEEEHTNALAAHIISAIKLSSCNNADQAAALMQALRFVGRNLAGSKEIPVSQATAICLASIGSNYPRPAWLPSRLASELSQLFQPDLLNEISKNLIK